MQQGRILVVDDDEDIVRIVQSKLADTRLNSDAAGTAQGGLAKMRKQLYQVVIADIHMPGMSGVEMLSALKDISPLVQVIMLTSDATVSRVIECIDRGAVDFFPKTDSFGPLIDAVHLSLERAIRWGQCIGYQSPVTLAHA